MPVDKISNDIAVEVEKILEQLEQDISWYWTKTLVTGSVIKNDNLLVDQIFLHIWADKSQRRTIRALLYYDIASVFFDEETAAEKVGITKKEYDAMYKDVLKNVRANLMDYLLARR